MVGFTALKQELGDQKAFGIVQAHHQIIRNELKKFGAAREIQTAGDEFFLIFAAPSEAVIFSLRVQKELRQLSRAVGRTVQDRIGIHIGEALINEAPESVESGL